MRVRITISLLVDHINVNVELYYLVDRIIVGRKMFGVFSIICIFAIILESFGNPVNITDVENSESQSDYLCDRNVFLISNQSLFEVNIKEDLGKF